MGPDSKAPIAFLPAGYAACAWCDMMISKVHSVHQNADDLPPGGCATRVPERRGLLSSIWSPVKHTHTLITAPCCRSPQYYWNELSSQHTVYPMWDLLRKAHFTIFCPSLCLNIILKVLWFVHKEKLPEIFVLFWGYSLHWQNSLRESLSPPFHWLNKVTLGKNKNNIIRSFFFGHYNNRQLPSSLLWHVMLAKYPTVLK